MYKPLALISVLASVALAQIPSGISTGCTTFLTSLNSDATLNACTAAVISATSAYSSGASASSSAISNSLSPLCQTTTTCSQSTLRAQLTSFYQSCNAELTGSSANQDVQKIYDLLYALSPLTTAMCSKDDSGDYCVTQTSTAISAVQSATGLSSSDVQKYLSSSNSPNTTTFGATNLVFLFLTPSLGQTDLCTTCARNVISAFSSWENDISYGPGLAASSLMSGQTKLTTAVQSTCGSSFLSGAVQAAGGLGSDQIIGAAPRSFGVEFKGLAVAVVGILFTSSALGF